MIHELLTYTFGHYWYSFSVTLILTSIIASIVIVKYNHNSAQLVALSTAAVMASICAPVAVLFAVLAVYVGVTCALIYLLTRCLRASIKKYNHRRNVEEKLASMENL